MIIQHYFHQTPSILWLISTQLFIASQNLFSKQNNTQIPKLIQIKPYCAKWWVGKNIKMIVLFFFFFWYENDCTSIKKLWLIGWSTNFIPKFWTFSGPKSQWDPSPNRPIVEFICAFNAFCYYMQKSKNRYFTQSFSSFFFFFKSSQAGPYQIPNL